ncbi:MAG TPA: chorismate mutase [Spirochaetota bacterium]|nr:chorismate mutase [Spirochaetota bacterium]HOL58202.1 chorismate mutase [Spirochaetota bacterium]HPP04515.1 chorismate mutase [Spirochaetota bacterium]
MSNKLDLNEIRNSLIRLEETIIFVFIERAQFKKNKIVYEKDSGLINGNSDSLLIYLLKEMEKIYAYLGRYLAPDEHPFTDNLPIPLKTLTNYEYPIKRNNININKIILKIYIEEIIPLICKDGDDNNYGSSVVCDVNVLQALSKRIHYGKFVAESKYISEKDIYDKLIQEGNKEKIFERLTNKKVEDLLLERVKIKASTYGQDPWEKNPEFKIKPEVVRDIYEKWIIPLTKEVEYLYLIERVK